MHGREGRSRTSICCAAVVRTTPSSNLLYPCCAAFWGFDFQAATSPSVSDHDADKPVPFHKPPGPLPAVSQLLWRNIVSNAPLTQSIFPSVVRPGPGHCSHCNCDLQFVTWLHRIQPPTLARHLALAMYCFCRSLQALRSVVAAVRIDSI